MKVLMTGAAGGVARMARPMLRELYPDLVLSDLKRPDDLRNDETFLPADLTDMAAVETITRGIDGVIHLGGVSVERSWDEILPTNIVGCHNLFEAARRNKVKRVIFASSNHAIGFYPRARRIGTDNAVRPDGYYGVSKAFGEAIGALYAYKHGLRVASLRIGNVDYKPVDLRRLSIWIHPEDLVQLFVIGLEHPEVRCEIFYGASNNVRSYWDNRRAFELGYDPVHVAEHHRDEALAAQAQLAADPVADWFQGGSFCSDGYDSKDELPRT
jgi:uronate dehydrogenase